MAYPMADSSLSLVPYNSENHEIVLRHGSAVVRYDENSRQILLGDVLHEEDARGGANCPQCGRPFDTEFQHAKYSAKGSSAITGESVDFIDPDLSLIHI